MMKNYISFLLLLLLLPVGLMAKVRDGQLPTRQIPVGYGYGATSVNNTVFRNSSLCTLGDEQYISYYDSLGYVVLGKRKLGDETFQLSRTQYKGKVSDAHNVISIMADGDGYLHVSFDHHGNALRYCRSVAPHSLELGPLEPMISPDMEHLTRDEKDVTYPEFYRLAWGDLLFAYRSGASGRGNLVLNKYNVRTREWSRVQDILIDGENQRNAYWQLYVDAAGTIHVSWVWRETWMVETNHDLCYACSHDGGVTWEHADGTPYSLPITAANAEYAWRIPQESELINQTSMSADAKGHPYIATYWRDVDSDVPQYRMVWYDGKRWQQQQVSSRTTPFSLKGGGTKMIPISRPRMAVDGKRCYYLFRDEERGSKVSLFYTANLKKGKWQVMDLTDYPVHAWEPTIDTELWKQSRRLDVFVQDCYQGDGERTVAGQGATQIGVLEVGSH